MLSPIAQGSRRQGTLLLADISGYTGFLQGVADAHRVIILEADEPPPAYAVVSSLLDTMVTVIAPAFRLVKFVQQITGREELLGPDVNAVHRLLKNHARELIGARPYALLTDAAMAALDVPAEDMIAARETYEDMPPIPVHILALA